MVWYQLRFRYLRGKVYHTGGVIYKNLEDARKEANRLLSVRDDIRDGRIEIWTTQGIYETRSPDDMFVEAVVKRSRNNHTKRSKTNEFGLDLNLR